MSDSGLTHISLRDFRCFDSAALEFGAGFTFFIGANAQGKTSLLEAICVLLRLQSPRSSRLANVLQHGKQGFVVDGRFNDYHLQFYFSSARKKLALDSVEQKVSREYLALGHVVYFGNEDIRMVQGGSDLRRRYLDFVATQAVPGYRQRLRDYGKALRARNRLLKTPGSSRRALEAFTQPLLKAGNALSEYRAEVITHLHPHIVAAHRAIVPRSESLAKTALQIMYQSGSGGDFARALHDSHEEEVRLRQTVVGPHRDDMQILLGGVAAAEFASEGQQRTIALCLRLAQAAWITARSVASPVLLLDDIFGELDHDRRKALLRCLPEKAQKFVTATHLDWVDSSEMGTVFSLQEGGAIHRSEVG